VIIFLFSENSANHSCSGELEVKHYSSQLNMFHRFLFIYF
jgi:hypothetical protein